MYELFFSVSAELFGGFPSADGRRRELIAEIGTELVCVDRMTLRLRTLRRVGLILSVDLDLDLDPLAGFSSDRISSFVVYKEDSIN